MSKYDRNGVKHSGWASVGEANQNHRGHSGYADRSYEQMAREQGVDLSQTHYRKTQGYSHTTASAPSRPEPGSWPFDGWY